MFKDLSTGTRQISFDSNSKVCLFIFLVGPKEEREQSRIQQFFENRFDCKLNFLITQKSESETKMETR